MKAIFLKSSDSFENAVPKIYAALGITEYKEGDSLHVLGGVYGVFNIFGMNIKVEENSYDYDDEYRYMVSVRSDVLSNIQTTEENEKMITRVVCDLFFRNLQTKVAMEVEDELIVYHPFEGWI